MAYNKDSPVDVFNALAKKHGAQDTNFTVHDTWWEPFRQNATTNLLVFTQPTKLQLENWMRYGTSYASVKSKMDEELLRALRNCSRSFQEDWRYVDAAVTGMHNFLGEYYANELRTKVDRYRYMSKDHAYALLRSMEERGLAARAASLTSTRTTSETQTEGSSRQPDSVTSTPGFLFTKQSYTYGGVTFTRNTSKAESVTRNEGHEEVSEELQEAMRNIYFCRPREAGGKLLKDEAFEEKLLLVQARKSAVPYLYLKAQVLGNGKISYSEQANVIDRSTTAMLEKIDRDPANWSDDEETTW